jgi:hypothetical protein
MVKAFSIATILFLLAHCGGKSSQLFQRKGVAPQPSNAPSPEPSRSKCEFSNYGPFKLGPSTSGYAVSLLTPKYPPEAKEQNAEGQVTVKLLINVSSGKVEQSCLVSGNNVFEKSSTEAALRSKFSFATRPKRLPDTYVYAEGIIVYRFVSQ